MHGFIIIAVKFSKIRTMLCKKLINIHSKDLARLFVYNLPNEACLFPSIYFINGHSIVIMNVHFQK